MSLPPVYVILGRGGQGRDVLDALLAAGRTVAGVFDDSDPPLPDGIPLLGGIEDWRTVAAAGVEVMPGMGNSTERCELAAAILVAGASLASAIHPAAVISPQATAGAGRVHRRRLRHRPAGGYRRPDVHQRQLLHRPRLRTWRGGADQPGRDLPRRREGWR